MLMVAQPTFEAGIFVGGSNYQGDLVPTEGPVLSETRPTVGIVTRLRLSNYFALRSNILYGEISGSDLNFDDESYVIRRNANFTNKYADLALLAEWEPFAFWKQDSLERRKVLSPYIFAGAGLSMINPVLDPGPNNDFTSVVLPDLEADFSKAVFNVPFGGGINFVLSKAVSLRFELGMRYTNSDYLDGISLAGNPEAKDWMWFGGTNLSFTFIPKDSDGDGVPDKEDRCPWIAGGVLARGCPDQDNDGVEDGEDLCPEIPGPLLLNGCPDADGDGIPDVADNCPTEYGFEETGGCPDDDNDCVPNAEDKCPDIEGLIAFGGCIDTDGDSIPDPEDACPREMGLAAYGGCPLTDIDCDGVLDKDDQCPTLASETGFSGCPDMDEDGIADIDDKCPENKGSAESNGCPELSTAALQNLERISKNVKFRTGSSNLLARSRDQLEQVVDLLRQYTDYSLSISGYTDNRGRASTNLRLSRERAKACYDYILEKGIDPDRLQYNGYGESKPIGDNNTSAGREQNRRVEFEMALTWLQEK
jgi:outer membrane protein OmpA-like peptidoglycan-associated protein